jgi:hypothetical protein
VRLLVSVASAAEAVEAIEGGADIVDAKDPAAGALGAVSPHVLAEIGAAVHGRRLLTAALGDATSEAAIERDARAFASRGATLVKVGFAGTSSGVRVAALLAAAVRGARAGCRHAGAQLQAAPCDAHGSSDGHVLSDVVGVVQMSCGVIAVANADADFAASIDRHALVDAAAASGAAGVLLDTANKRGPGLRDLVSAEALADWIAAAHDARLIVAVAGKLAIDDFAFARDAGADVVGVRGAACEGGRTGRVTAERVRVLRNSISTVGRARGDAPASPSACLSCMQRL